MSAHAEPGWAFLPVAPLVQGGHGYAEVFGELLDSDELVPVFHSFDHGHDPVDSLSWTCTFGPKGFSKGFSKLCRQGDMATLRHGAVSRLMCGCLSGDLSGDHWWRSGSPRLPETADEILDVAQSIDSVHEANPAGEPSQRSRNGLARRGLSLVGCDLNAGFGQAFDRDFRGLCETVERLLRGSSGLLGGHEHGKPVAHWAEGHDRERMVPAVPPSGLCTATTAPTAAPTVRSNARGPIGSHIHWPPDRHRAPKSQQRLPLPVSRHSKTHASATSCRQEPEMLSLAKAAKDYYLQKLGEVSPREDYYLRGGTAVGRWVGSGAAELELRGTVSAKGLVRLFDGEHPVNGKRLGRRLRKDGVAAWDVTFSADKSVSLLWALGDEHTRKEVVEAFEEATSQALGCLEGVASATRGATKTMVVDEEGIRKCRVKTWPIPTSGYVAAAFTEYTSRADDPQVHTHVVIANKVRGEDGVWRTLDGRLLYRHQLAAGYVHEAVLRKELTERLGVAWQPVRNGMADIEGFTRTQIEAFSRRREQLEAWREEQDLPDTPAARQIAVVATREAKRDHPREELEVEWRQRAAEVGLTPERIDRILDRGRLITTPDRSRLFARLASSEGLTAKKATFGRSEAVREIAASLPEGGDRDQIEALADQFLADDQVVSLSSGAGSDLKYTTAELMATEQRVIDRAEDRTSVTWPAPRRLAEAVLRRRPHLTEDQREMVRRLATSGAGIDVGVGPAGSGKTSIMAVVAHLATLTGTPIVGTALAARTAVGLQEATRIASSSLAALNHRATTEGGLPDGVVVVVDEASMVGTRQLATLSDHVNKAGGKLILIGDPHQLPEIEAGDLFNTLVDRLPAVELHQNIRQDQPWERTALDELRNGSVADAVASYRKHRRLVNWPDQRRDARQSCRRLVPARHDHKRPHRFSAARKGQ